MTKTTAGRWPMGAACALLCVATALAQRGPEAAPPGRIPANRATGVNPDTHLVLTFDAPPAIGTSGAIRIYDAATDTVVDTLDLAVAAGPRQGAPEARYQQMVIGGFTEGFHFYPVIVHGNAATIYPHEHALAYGKTYYVQVDAPALVARGFAGVSGRDGWRFTTKKAPPSATTARLVVASDGTGDFTTVQGAVDFVPDHNPRPTTVFIRKGVYEEIVYFRNKTNVLFLGEDRAATVVGYANNEAFNGPPAGVGTNERPDTFPYRRAAFMADRSSDIQIANLTIENFTPRGGGQAEALLLSGGRNVVDRVSLRGHQDTVQFNDSVYVENSDIEGDTDFLWGRGPALFKNSTLRELAAGPFMWVRSTAASHGFVFVSCRFEVTPGAPAPGPFLARNTAAYPNSEVILLDSALGAINPIAWSLPAAAADMRYWEYGSTNLADASPADVSRRRPASKALTLEADAATIAALRNPATVLGGWTPILRAAGRTAN